MRLDNTERQKFYLQNMKASSDHLLSLVSDLLDFHRLESHKLDINHIAFSPKVLFDKIVSAMQPVADKKQLNLVLKVEKSADANFSGDPLRIQCFEVYSPGYGDDSCVCACSISCFFG